MNEKTYMTVTDGTTLGTVVTVNGENIRPTWLRLEIGHVERDGSERTTTFDVDIRRGQPSEDPSG